MIDPSCTMPGNTQRTGTLGQFGETCEELQILAGAALREGTGTLLQILE